MAPIFMLSGRWGFSINDQRVYQQAAGEITELQALLSNRLGSQTEQLRRGTFHFHTTLCFAIFSLLLLPTDLRLQILKSLKQCCTKNSHEAYIVQLWAEATSLVFLVLRLPDYWTTYRFPQHSSLQTWDRSPCNHISQYNKDLLSIIPTFCWLCSSEKSDKISKEWNFPNNKVFKVTLI